MQAVATRRVTQREEFICKCREGRQRFFEALGERVGTGGERVGERSAHRGSGGSDTELERVLCRWPLGRVGLCLRVA